MYTAPIQVQDAHEAAVREQLLGKADDGDDDVPLLDPTSIHGWVPYKPVSEKPQGSRFCRNTCALAWKNFTKLRCAVRVRAAYGVRCAVCCARACCVRCAVCGVLCARVLRAVCGVRCAVCGVLRAVCRVLPPRYVHRA